VNAPYHTVEQALAFGFGMEAKVVCKLSGFPDRNGGAKGAGPYAAHAQAAMITALVGRSLQGALLAAIWAQFTVPADQALRWRKLLACTHLAIAFDGAPKLDRTYMREVAREWARLPRCHDDTWWSKRLGVGERRLRQLKHGRAERNQPGLMGRLDEVYDRALARLAPVLVERELVESAWDSCKAAY
jgi:hypothetical protein